MSVGDTRRDILWIGPAPNASLQREFAARRLSLVPTIGAEVNARLPTARGLLVQYDNGKPSLTRNVLRESGGAALDHGVAILVRSDGPHGPDEVAGFLAAMRWREQERRRIEVRADGDEAIAERFARHEPGRFFQPVRLQLVETDGTLHDVDPGDARLTPTARFFLQRAFSDCEKIEVHPLSGGFSADVFEVYAVFGRANRPRPLPFFAKVDKCGKVAGERRNYENLVDNYVPFSHRPHLETDRCLVGHTHGILVGDYVERSEPFLEAVRRNDGSTVIYSLFEDALRGWHLQAYAERRAPALGYLRAGISHYFFPRLIMERHRERVEWARERGARSPNHIATALKAMPPRPHRRGIVHGDLHVGNIRVRNNQALLIDFNATKNDGPILIDAAMLEVSALFKSYGSPSAPNDAGEAEFERERWTTLVKRLYSFSYLQQRVPEPPIDTTPRQWMWSLVRQIRQHALGSQTEVGEYAILVAMALLRIAMLARAEEPRDELRFCLAYGLADRLLLEAGVR